MCDSSGSCCNIPPINIVFFSSFGLIVCQRGDRSYGWTCTVFLPSCILLTLQLQTQVFLWDALSFRMLLSLPDSLPNCSCLQPLSQKDTPIDSVIQLGRNMVLPHPYHLPPLQQTIRPKLGKKTMVIGGILQQKPMESHVTCALE